MGRYLAAAVLACAATPAAAQADGKQWLSLADGESRELSGTTYVAHGAVQAIVVLSSEYSTVAVIDGTLAAGKLTAGPGEALVTPVENGRIERLSFDAARLKPSLRPEWLATAAEPLDRIAARQKRAKFWGRLEPAGVNAAAPASPLIESVRHGYMANPTIAELRRQADGKMAVLAELTAQKFASALAGGDTPAVAALIDPKPFTDTNAAVADWQAARVAFADSLSANTPLRTAMGAGAPTVDPANAAQFVTGGYRITLVKRDRALFVAAAEPQS